MRRPSLGIDCATLESILAEMAAGRLPMQPPVPLTDEALQDAIETALYYADDRWKTNA